MFRLVVLVVGRDITRPVIALTDAIRELAHGNCDGRAEADRGDEIGQMANSVLVFQEGGVGRIRLEEEAEANRKLTEEERARSPRGRKPRRLTRGPPSKELKAAAEQAGVVDALAGGLAKISEGDLTVRLNFLVTGSRRPIVRSAAEASTTPLPNACRKRSSTIAGGGREITDASGEISTSTTNLSQRTEEQAAEP